LEDYWGSVIMSCYFKKVVAEAGDISRNQRKRNFRL
jgi:hypothetical protein